MITAVTPNPSLDRTLRVADLRRGELNRAKATDLEPSGKGVNVAVALQIAGTPSTAVLPVGGDSGRSLLAMLAERGVRCRTVPIDGAVRTNVSVIEDDGTTTKINEAGPVLSSRDVAQLVEITLATSEPGEWVAWCGSLPSGFSVDALGEALATCRAAGRRVALDTSEAALQTLLHSTGRPHLVKPNGHELSDLIGRPLPTLGDVVSAARELVANGVETVAVTLGADGAVVVDQHQTWFGRAEVDRVANTAGAGDAFLAGYLAAAQGPMPDRLATALRFSAVAVQSPGTLIASAPSDIAVEVGPVRPGLTLSS